MSWVGHRAEHQERSVELLQVAPRRFDFADRKRTTSILINSGAQKKGVGCRV